MLAPATIEAAQAAVRDCPPGRRIRALGGGTKPALSTAPDAGCHALVTTGLAGVLEYEASEYTFTALAGTRLGEVNAMLEKHGQCLPFDPPLAARGATLGGTVAAGLSGPGRHRFGGVRDFLIGLRFVDGAGRLVRGGSKVVKNAAGFDLPKLMAGSLGSLGLLVELSFKVFPRPETYASVRLGCSVDEGVQAIRRLTASQMDLEALDLAAGDEAGEGALWARLGGLEAPLPARLDRLRGLLGGGEAVQGEAEAAHWRESREFAWAPEGWSLIKVPLTPARIALLEAGLAGRGTLRRYSAGGQVLWLAAPGPASEYDALLAAQGLAGLALWGPGAAARIGARAGEGFARRVKQALDPDGRFAEA